MVKRPDQDLFPCVQSVVLPVRYTVLDGVERDLYDNQMQEAVVEQLRREMSGLTWFDLGATLKIQIREQIFDST